MRTPLSVFEQLRDEQAWKIVNWIHSVILNERMQARSVRGLFIFLTRTDARKLGFGPANDYRGPIGEIAGTQVVTGDGEISTIYRREFVPVAVWPSDDDS